MSHRQMIFLAAVAALGIACVSTEAFAWRGAVAHHGVVGVRGGTVGYRNGVYGGGYYRPGVGLAAGAVVGGAIAASQYGGYGYGGYGYGGYGYDNSPGYYGYNPGYSVGYTSGGQDTGYCVQRYRSYDPASGTYLGHDGRRHPCP